MINTIIDAISNKLHQTYPTYEIYGDRDVVQGVSTPCFFIAVLSPSEDYLIGNRRHRQYPFDVHYFPVSSNDNVECLNVADTLLDELEYITLANNDVLRGTHKNYEIVDGVLHFRVMYNMCLKYVQELQTMQDISTTISVGGD